jgi:hypothetical protein
MSLSSRLFEEKLNAWRETRPPANLAQKFEPVASQIGRLN